MKIENFELERIQSYYENLVDFNLSESGIHPYALEEFLTAGEMQHLSQTRLTYGQTNGSIPLRQAVAALYPDTTEDQVLITNGSIEANFLAHFSMLERGDEIAYMLPNYQQVWGLARSLGVRIIPFRLNEELNWGPELDTLAKSVTARTKMITICNPNNPTGAVLSQEAMEEIVRIAASVGAWIYADEIYRGAELNNEETASFRGMYDRVLVAGGLSKAYALPGLRIGWLVGPKNITDRAWALHDYTTIAPAVLSDYVATIALQPKVRQNILARNRIWLQQNLEILNHWVSSWDGHFRLIPPQSGGMAFLGYDWSFSAAAFSDELRKQESVLIVPGTCFGMDGFIRIGFGAEPDYLKSGLSRTTDFLKRWLKN